MVVVLSVFEALLRRASAVERALPERNARKVVVGLGDALSNACMSGR